MSGALPIRRTFLTVDGREVHCRSVGSGPPALFIHSSPTNSSFVLPDMLAQADRYTCFAFDTPGFGLSEPLPLAEMIVADLADAIAAAMAALGLPPVPVFGTHSGAAIALELGVRHPEKVTGLVLDGVPIFTPDELARFADDRYFAALAVDPLGGHYAATWTRFRDQSIWFPWFARHPDALNEYDLLPPEALHRWTEMFFAAAAHYKPAYRAATRYGDRAPAAVAALTVPAVFTASETDMLHPHLVRLPPLRDGQEIAAFGTDPAVKYRLTGEAFARFGSAGSAPAPGMEIAASDRVRRQFVADGTRGQMIRHAGDPGHPATLLLHDLPGSGRLWEARIAELARDRFVIAPDLPGSGESEGLGAAAGLADYAAALWRLCDAIGLVAVDIEGRGLAASLALEMAVQAPQRVRAIAIDGLLLPDAAERATLAAQSAPPITIERDGAHWYRLWLQLRDACIYWPWFETRRAALRRVPADLAAETLHLRTIETMKQRGSYHHLIDAVLRHDAAACLSVIRMPIRRIADPLAALGAAYGARLDTLIGTGREKDAA